MKRMAVIYSVFALFVLFSTVALADVLVTPGDLLVAHSGKIIALLIVGGAVAVTALILYLFFRKKKK